METLTRSNAVEEIAGQEALEKSIVATKGFVEVAVQRVREGLVNGDRQEVTLLDPESGTCFRVIDHNVREGDDGMVYSTQHPFQGLAVSIEINGRTVHKLNLPRDPYFVTRANRIGSLKDLPAASIAELTESLRGAEHVPALALASTPQEIASAVH